jgi:hypothetical protein
MLLTEGRWLIQSLLVGVAVSSTAWLLNYIVTFAIAWWEKLNPPCDLPILNLKGWRFDKAKQEYVTRLDHYLEIGRSKYRETGYQLWSPEGYKIILPPRFYEEAGVQNDDVLNNDAAKLRILGGYDLPGANKIGIEFADTITVVKRHLQGSVVLLGNEPSELMQAEIFARFPHSNGKKLNLSLTVTAEKNVDWTELVCFPKLLATIATTNTTILFGEELAKDPKMVQAAINFPMNLITAGLKLRKLTYSFKVLAVELGLMPEAAKVRSWVKYARQAVPPVLRAREEASQNDSTYKKPNDFIQWRYDSILGTPSKRNVESVGVETLFIMSAAVHTTAMNLVNVIHHIAWFPEHNAALRKEIDRVWAESNGNINSSNAAQLDKLDSYIMEASRHGNFKRSNISYYLLTVTLLTDQTVNLDRNITSKNGFTFSNGLHLRRGACFAMDTTGQEMDPALWGDPYKFVPFRFSDARARAGPGDRKIWFTSTSPKDAMQFGYGKHSCPGRGFATLMLKIFLATLLHDFDVEPLEGADFPKQVDRGTVSGPPTDVKLRFRKRKV